MTLGEYVKAFPLSQRFSVRVWIASQLGVSESYVRSMCNGMKKTPAKYAIKIEKLTDGVVPRYVTAPDIYPADEYSLHKFVK